MNLDLRMPDWLLAAAVVTLVLWGCSMLLSMTSAMVPAVVTGVLILLALDVRRKLIANMLQYENGSKSLRKEVRDAFGQTEALLALIDTLKPVYPMPSTRGWAASPDLLLILAQRVLDRRPRLVVELGSGVSTLALGYALQKSGGGRLVSVEHEEAYAQRTQERVRRHGLEAIVTVVLCPLSRRKVDGDSYLWYDLAGLQFDGKIDLLLVDGPPGKLQPWSRYPALPVLQPHLAADASIVLDDACREEERAIVAAWQKRYSDWRVMALGTEKDGLELMRV
jgi:predicted O-methyltransferase YrrM